MKGIYYSIFDNHIYILHPLPAQAMRHHKQTFREAFVRRSAPAAGTEHTV